MNTLATILFVTMHLAIDAGFEDQAAIQGSWRGVRFHDGMSATFAGETVTLTSPTRCIRSRFRIHDGEIDVADKGEPVRGRYVIEGNRLILFFADRGEERPNSLQPTIVGWEKLTERAARLAKQGASTDTIRAGMPDWYFRVWFFERIPIEEASAAASK
ncbi:MAG: hypothetical protein AB7O59_11800 [Pirellulales bacterium]